MKHAVSIIIPARNEEKIIAKAIESMQQQIYPRKEIIVMDNASTDRTAEISRKHKVKVIKNEKNIGIGNSVNRGIKASKCKFTVILHADHYTNDKKWIDKMLEPFSDKKVAAVVSQRKNKDRDKMSLGERLFDSLHPPSVNTSGKLMEISILREKADVYRKNIIEKLGYFDGDSYPHGGEDVDMSIKIRQAGYKIVLSNEAMVEHVFSSHQSSFISVFRKAFQMGQAGSELYRRYKIDSVRRRMFLMILFSLTALPVARTDVGIFLYSLFFLLGIFSYITLSGKRIPLTVIYTLVFFLFYLQTNSNASIISGVLLTNVMVLAYYGMHSSRNSLKEGDNLIYALLIFPLSIAWRFTSALGYLKEELFPSKI